MAVSVVDIIDAPVPGAASEAVIQPLDNRSGQPGAMIAEQILELLLELPEIHFFVKCGSAGPGVEPGVE